MRTPETMAEHRKFSRIWQQGAQGLKTHEGAALGAQNWLDQTCKTHRANHVKNVGYRASRLHELEYFDMIRHHVFDWFHLILEGTLTFEY